MTAVKKKLARKAVRASVGVRTPVRQRPSGPSAKKFAITNDEREVVAQETIAQLLIYAPIMKKEARLAVTAMALLPLAAKVPLREFLVACERDYLWMASEMRKRCACERAARRAVAKAKRA